MVSRGEFFCYFLSRSSGQETNSINEVEHSHDLENAILQINASVSVKRKWGILGWFLLTNVPLHNFAYISDLLV